MNFKISVRDMRLLIILLLFFGCKMSAQITIGEWRTHLPYQFSNLVMLTEDKVFCSSTSGLFYYDLLDNSVEKMSKTDGLSDIGVAAMRWSEEDQLALLAYEDANVDILKGMRIINIPDIMKKQIPGDKTINNIYFSDRKAYLSCGFGIVVIDLEKLEIIDTYYVGDNGDKLAVNQVSSDGTYLYAATSQGIRTAEISNPFLIDYKSWQKLEDLPFPDGSYSGVEYFSKRVFVVYNDLTEQRDKLYFLDGTWKEYSQYSDTVCNEIRIAGSNLLLTGSTGVDIYNKEFLLIRKYKGGKTLSSTLSDDGILWIAEYGRGLVRVDSEFEETIKPNGPVSSIAYRMDEGGGRFYCVSGGVTTTYNNAFRPVTLMEFKDQRWRSNINYNYTDLVSIAIDRNDPKHVFAASWGYGLFEYLDNELIKIYDETNSSLQNASPVGSLLRLGGLTFDNQNNLWMTNTGVLEPVSVLKNDGTWKSFKANGILSSYPALGEIIFTEDGFLWGIIPKGGGLFAINFNGTIDNEEDDEYKKVNIVDENGNVITNEVYSLAEDQSGNIWLGTNEGILVYYNPADIFNEGSAFAQQICIPRNDGTIYCDPLLQTEKVTAIEVDGSNRKWLGTADGGVFQVSESGIEQLHYFNTGNSPLLSNSISDICVEGVSGEVFFGTAKGLISYKGEATKGASDYSKIIVYPNPVREDYNGPIVIGGLISETTVKITDISGAIVNELKSFGGQAVWDGTNFRGDRVATGTYLLFLAKGDGTQAAVSKILFIH